MFSTQFTNNNEYLQFSTQFTNKNKCLTFSTQYTNKKECLMFYLYIVKMFLINSHTNTFLFNLLLSICTFRPKILTLLSIILKGTSIQKFKRNIKQQSLTYDILLFQQIDCHIQSRLAFNENLTKNQTVAKISIQQYSNYKPMKELCSNHTLYLRARSHGLVVKADGS